MDSDRQYLKKIWDKSPRSVEGNDCPPFRKNVVRMTDTALPQYTLLAQRIEIVAL